jgi:PHP domain
VVHVHSTYSDGTASVPELLEAAREAEVDALLLTDHDTLGARRDGWEGLHDGVFLMVGLEVSPKQGHYLAFGVGQVIRHRGRSAAEIAAAVRAAGGVGIAAHPFSRGGSMLIPTIARRIVLPHGWPALDQEGGLDGLELWSVLTDAAEAWRTPAEAVRWLREPEAAIVGGPPARHLAVWDRLSARRRVPAIGGLDDHQRGLRVRGRVRSPLPPSRTFNLLRTHLLCQRPLSGEVERDRETVVTALRDGAAWLTCPSVAPARGASMWAERSDGSTMGVGAEGPAATSVLRLRLPRPADVTVRRDGTAIHAGHSAQLDLDIADRGAYRVEARIDGGFWLLSNPIHLR